MFRPMVLVVKILASAVSRPLFSHAAFRVCDVTVAILFTNKPPHAWNIPPGFFYTVMHIVESLPCVLSARHSQTYWSGVCSETVPTDSCRGEGGADLSHDQLAGPFPTQWRVKTEWMRTSPVPRAKNSAIGLPFRLNYSGHYLMA